MTFVAMFRDGVLVVVPDPYAVILPDYVKRTIGESVWFTEIVTDAYAHALAPARAIELLRARVEQRLWLIRVSVSIVKYNLHFLGQERL